MVVTNDEEHARRIRMLRDWGQETKYHHILRGFNYRMDGVQGAILRVKLRHLDRWTDERRKHAALYRALLKNANLLLPDEMPYAHHVYHIFAVRTAQRDALQAALQSRDIQTGIHYPIPVHLQDAYRGLGRQAGDLAITEQASGEVLSLPMYAELTDEQIGVVCSAVSDFVG
jgi:dTDP-4-amino-4,6-dideoxygalactose transaminase